MRIPWNSSYSVNVKEIDEQHKKLLEMINNLADITLSESKVPTDDERNKLENILNELIRYTEYHFSTEEDYFDEFDYENADSHKKEHKKFVEKIKEFMKRFRNKEASISFELINFLQDWLIDHIMGTDKKYTKCFNEHGLY
jgi:hemerythrin